MRHNDFPVKFFRGVLAFVLAILATAVFAAFMVAVLGDRAPIAIVPLVLACFFVIALHKLNEWSGG